MFRRTSVAVIIALLLVISISGLYFVRSDYRYNDGRPKEDYIDRFVDDSLIAGNNFVGGMSETMNTMQEIFGFIKELPIIKDLVSRDKKDWSEVEYYTLDYRKEVNRYKTDIDVLPPEEYANVGDEFIVKIICADYNIWQPARIFYRIWYYGENGYWTDYKCYHRAVYKTKSFFSSERIRKVDAGQYKGICPLGYVEYKKIDWIK